MKSIRVCYRDCYIDSCNFDLVGYMFGYNYKSVGWMVGCITVSSLYILWELRVSWLNSWSYHYDSFDWVGYRVGSIVNSWSCGCYIKQNGWMNITKELVISFRQCGDKIGWLYTYNNTKWLYDGPWCGQMDGFLVISSNKLWWVGYVYKTNIYSSSVLVK